MNRRADKFDALASSEHLMQIQNEMLTHYKDDINALDVSDMDRANIIVTYYLRIAIDEGYREAIKEYNELAGGYKPLEVKPRQKDVLHYVEEGEDKSLVKLVKKRIKSKRQRKSYAELQELKEDERFPEEQFVLCMVCHTGFEYGFMKGSSVEEYAKMMNPDDPEKAKMFSELFNDIFKEVLDAPKVT